MSLKEQEKEYLYLYKDRLDFGRGFLAPPIFLLISNKKELTIKNTAV